MIIRSGNQTENICSIGFWDVRGGVTLRRLMLRSLECIWCSLEGNKILNLPSFVSIFLGRLILHDIVARAVSTISTFFLTIHNL